MRRLCTVLIGLSFTAFSTVAAAAAEPTITVGPTTSLVDGTAISVSVLNPRVNTSVSVRQCFGSDSTDQCWTYVSGLAAGGPITINASRTQFYGAPLGPLVDCAVLQCYLRIEASQPFVAPYLSRDIALTFAPTAPTFRQPIAIASQTTALVDRQVISVAGLGFSPGAEFRIRQCWVPFTYPWLERCQGNVTAAADVNGMLASSFTVRRTFTTLTPAVTCGDSDTPCFIIVQRTDALGERATVMISFGTRTFAPPTLIPLAVTVAEDVGVAMVPVLVAAEPDRLVSTVALNWRTLPWSAGSADFTSTDRSLIVSAYLPVIYLPVRIINDTVNEPDEIVFTHIPSAINATVGGYSGVGVIVIVDND